MTSARADLWRELVEIRNVIREIAIRHNIEAHEDDDVYVILNEMQLDDFVDENYGLPESLKQFEEEKECMKNIFETVDVDTQHNFTKELIKESMETAEDMIDVQIEISDEIFSALALEAHKRDLTLSQFIAKILEDYVSERKKEK